MPEPNAAVVEEPKPTEQEITDSYIEKRLAGKTTDLPVPPPTVEETIKPAEPEPVFETPQMKDVQAVDRFLEERQIRRKRGGAQVKIDQLTREKAELEAKTKELEAKVPAEPAKVEPKAEVVVPPVVEAPKPEAKERPKIEDFTDANDYHAAMALWAVDERAKAVPKTEQPPPVAPQVLQVRQEEFDKFLERGKTFVAGHPDFNTILEAAHVRGLTISEQARVAITRLAAPEVAYWLAKPENDLAARQLMRLDEGMQVVEVGRIAERLAVSPADFVSNAPAPGTRINGNSRNEVPLSQIQDTDEYIRRRKQEKQARRGR